MKRIIFGLFFLGQIVVSPKQCCGGNIYLVKGLYTDYYQIEKLAANLNYKIQKVSTYSIGQSGPAINPQFPSSLTELAGIKIIILSNINIESFGFMGRKTLFDFIKSGGSLLLLGGHIPFGKAKIVKSFIAEVLPVSIIDSWNIKKNIDGIVKIKDKHPITENLVWDSHLKIYYYHQVKAKENSTVLLELNENPILTIWQTEQGGKIAVFTGTPLGKPSNKDLPLWEWEGWEKMMINLIQWLGKD